MCGRINVHDYEPIQDLMEELGLPMYPIGPTRFNIAPSLSVPVISDREFRPMDWGIEFGKFRHPNSKAETIRRKPFLQKLLVTQRCLIPVNGFYEWPDIKVRPNYQNRKTRFFIHTPENVMLLAGIYKQKSEHVSQFNIITTDPNEQINDFHHRMPVIIKPQDVGQWFDEESTGKLLALLRPYTDPLNIYECDAFVNNARNDGPQCMAPLSKNS